MERVFEDVIQQRCVVILPFLFSDLQRKKARPAIIVSNNMYNRYSDDIVTIPLTSNLRPSRYGILITNRNMEYGELIADSNARVDKIFSVEKSLVMRIIGKVDNKTHLAIQKVLFTLVK